MAVFLLGNGINLLEGAAPDWTGLVNRVRERLQISEPFCHGERETSMTLGFERFALNAMRSDALLRDKHIKHAIQRELNACGVPADWAKRDTLHRWLLGQNVTDILTTNYDYLLECAAAPDFRPRHTTTETAYSLRRRQQVSVDGQPRRIWHIHGELRTPRSICLGFEQYMGALQRIRSYLTESVPNGFRLGRILAGDEDETAAENWCHLFFTQDVHIIGFGLDYSETDIWWLLNYRARAMLTEELDIENHICFYDTNPPDPYKRGLLTSFGVEYLSFAEGSYPERYAALRKALAERL